MHLKAKIPLVKGVPEQVMVLVAIFQVVHPFLHSGPSVIPAFSARGRHRSFSAQHQSCNQPQSADSANLLYLRPCI